MGGVADHLHPRFVRHRANAVQVRAQPVIVRIGQVDRFCLFMEGHRGGDVLHSPRRAHPFPRADG